MTLLGLDLGGSKFLGVALEDGEVVAETKVATPHDAAALAATLVEVVDSLSAGVSVDAAGVGAPGLVDREGVLRFAPNLAAGDGLNLREILADHLGVPVAADNDATCAAWGERNHGAGQGLDDMILVTVGTGIGGGIVVAGSIARGAHGFAGEIGHMVVDPLGPPCPCGQRGCWERFASGSALGRMGREAASAGRAGRVVELAGGEPAGVRGEHVTAAATEGDREATEILNRMAWWLALGLANLANIFDPRAAVIGGGMIVAGEALLAPTRAALAELLPAQRPPLELLPAALGERAGAIGAASLAGLLR